MSALNTQETANLSQSVAQIDRAIRSLRRELAPLVENADEDPNLKGKSITLDADEANWLVIYLLDARSKVNAVKQVKGYYPN